MSHTGAMETFTDFLDFSQNIIQKNYKDDPVSTVKISLFPQNLQTFIILNACCCLCFLFFRLLVISKNLGPSSFENSFSLSLEYK